MRRLKFILFVLLAAICFPVVITAQTVSVTDRTPEQEAIKQTEKLQSELKLTDEQAKIVYEINLRYARERQLSNSRSQAMERIRNKNEEIQRVLSPQQYDELLYRKNDVQTVEIDNAKRYIHTNPQNRVNNTDVKSPALRTRNSDPGVEDQRSLRMGIRQTESVAQPRTGRSVETNSRSVVPTRSSETVTTRSSSGRTSESGSSTRPATRR